MPFMLTGQKLRAIRSLRGISQSQLAKEAGVSATTVAQFEAGHSELRTDTVRKLCETLGVQVTYKMADGTEITGP